MKGTNFMLQQQEAAKRYDACLEELFKAGFISVGGVFYTTEKEHVKFQAIVARYYGEEAAYDNANRRH